MSKENNIVTVIGGGTGTFTVLNSLRDKNVDITALMTMVDDGGSNKIIRDEFGLLPTSGIRQAMVALSEQPSLLRELFMYRYHAGEGISGMTFGNLFLAAMADILGSQKQAIEETSKLLRIKGRILPISLDDVRLVATYEDGSEVMGEHLIDEPKHDGRLKITNLRTKPKASIHDQAKEAIKASDLVILGPGDLYTNTVANLIVEGVTQTLLNSRGMVVFFMNLMTKYGETYNYKASNYLEDLNKYLPLERVDVVVLNSDTNFPVQASESYAEEDAVPVEDDLDKMKLPYSTRVIRTPLIASEIAAKQKGDTLKRSMIRHDPEKLSQIILKILQ